MIEIPVFEGICNNCGWHMVLMAEHVVQSHAEEHAMQTGHIVDIKEIV